MSRRNEHIIFFTALAIMAVAFARGISYFRTQNTPDGLLADISSAVQSQNQNNPETIPTSTIVATQTASAPTLSPLTLPYSFSASIPNETYWPKAWGDISFTKNGLTLIPYPTTHGANSFLNGASSWSNYTVNANTSWLMGGWFDIVARVANNTQDFVYCEFGSNGTEIIGRVNGTDKQLAFTPISTANIEGAAENFGMKVYGNDVACLMSNREIVGVQVTTKEAPSGGIGFVIFGAPQNQKQVRISEISVSALSRNTIIAPYPPATSAPPTVARAPAVTTPTPAVILNPEPASGNVGNAVKTLPYSIGAFGDSFTDGDGWNNWWGSTTEANGVLAIEATSSDNGGGTLLAGSAAWSDYTFSATLDWLRGESFGMIARYENNKNYVVCNFNEQTAGVVRMSIQQHQNGTVVNLAAGNIINYNQLGGMGIAAAIQVEGNEAACGFQGHVISTLIASDALAPPLAGQIGFTAWDQTTGNSEIIVHSVGVVRESYSLGAYDTQP